MSLALYMDVHVPMEITERLRAAGVDVRTSQEDGADGLPDDEVLERAGALERASFTQDRDFLVIAAERQKAGRSFSAIFYARHDPGRIREYTEWLAVYATLGTLSDFLSKLTFIP